MAVYPFQNPTPEFGLANQANRFMSFQARQPFLTGLPGYASNLGQQGQNVGSMLRGDVPADVVRNIQQAGAERGIAMGMGGGANTNAAWLRALGLTSLGLQNQGAKQFSQMQSDLPVPELWNPMSLFVPERTAQQELAVAEGAGLNNWMSQSQQPWFMQSRWTAPSGSGGGTF